METVQRTWSLERGTGQGAQRVQECGAKGVGFSGRYRHLQVLGLSRATR